MQPFFVLWPAQWSCVIFWPSFNDMVDTRSPHYLLRGISFREISQAVGVTRISRVIYRTVLRVYSYVSSDHFFVKARRRS